MRLLQKVKLMDLLREEELFLTNVERRETGSELFTFLGLGLKRDPIRLLDQDQKRKIRIHRTALVGFLRQGEGSLRRKINEA